MRDSVFWDPVRHLQRHGISIRKGLQGHGEPEFMLEFERTRPWPPAKIQRAVQLLDQYRNLIRLQLDVPPGMPYRSCESLRAKGYIKIVELGPRQHRYVLTELGKRVLGEKVLKNLPRENH
ncbi:hypothetical protein N1030_01360 [Desulfovibrio mangrovi]|uniref:hypothetical protein n=1 Tax=Desulfovibrio mangrovi TaxID=2976983 RepID=UPI0022460C5B|nr:hypothetical protein [Desulfovibrio mangrovi]UZP67641.1 hypothetical protein N1030_01360 [Desulfovibrio mangrovi]